MTVLTDLVRDVITSGRLAHLVTVNPDGSPQLTVVWIDVEGDELVTGPFGRHQKVRNVARDRRRPRRARRPTQRPGMGSLGCATRRHRRR